MLLGSYYDGVEVYREEKIVYARFLAPHRVISTCQVAGGVRDDLDYLYNHQSSEPAGHHPASHSIAVRDPIAYREQVCRRHGLPPDLCATLGTAANMRYAIAKEAHFRDLTVVAVCTGGVEGNAGRAGDPASVYEYNGTYERISGEEPVLHGTINTMVFINRELTLGALVRTVMTATEAKTAVLQELAVNSRYSNRLATGTGTDQIGVASRLATGIPLRSAGKHSVLGELIGKVVHDAIHETLGLQNALTPEGQRSSIRHIERFGASRDGVIESVAARLDKRKAALLAGNFTGIERDPLVVAAVAALVHVRDKVAWGILPRSCVPELWATYGAQVAAAVSGDYASLPAYRDRLAERHYGVDDQDFLRLVEHAVAMGFQDKWPDERTGGQPPILITAADHEAASKKKDVS
ncbi:MAG: Adenosylcobinamide amidohydrolase [Syntrophaceae bacterium PtaU1.Bin231]|nr:MAG: Adenosylcobinamide amidohydrolase [Syntrophaceae bacterium PtaU1.Bin231]